MNLIQPPQGEKVLAWVLRHKNAALDYMRALFYLSRLTLFLTVNGATQSTALVFNGKNAELNLSFDTAGSGCALSVPLLAGTPYADAAAATAALAAQAIDCTLFAADAAYTSELSIAPTTGSVVVTKSTTATITASAWFPATISDSNLSMGYSIALDVGSSISVGLNLYDSAWTYVDSASWTDIVGVPSSPATGTLSLSGITPGCYFIGIAVDSNIPPSPSTTIGFTMTITSPGLVAGSQIAAQWDDGVDTGEVLCA